MDNDVTSDSEKKMGVKMNIRNKFEEIVSIYFPKWKNWRSWKVRRTTGDSECYWWWSPKTIVFNRDELLKEKDNVDLLFIHEIIHAVIQDGHNQKFLNRLKKTKTTASKLHRLELEKLIEKEIDMVSRIEKLPDYLKDRIRDIVIDNPDISWKELVEGIAAERGCKPRVITKYKFARKRFDHYKRMVEIERKTREKFGLPVLNET